MLRKKTRPKSGAPSLTPSLELDLPPPTLEIEWARSTTSLDLSGLSRSLSRLRKSSFPRGSKPPPTSVAVKEDLSVIPESPNGGQMDFSRPAPYAVGGSPAELDQAGPPVPTSPTSLNSWVEVQAMSPTAYQPMSPSSPTTPASSITPALGTTPISNYYTANNTSLDFSRVRSFPLPPERAILKLRNVSDTQLAQEWEPNGHVSGSTSELLDSDLPQRTSSHGHGALSADTHHTRASRTPDHLDVRIPMGGGQLSAGIYGHSPSDVESFGSSISTSDNYFSTVSTGTQQIAEQGPAPHTFQRVATSSPYYRPEANASTFSL